MSVPRLRGTAIAALLAGLLGISALIAGCAGFGSGKERSVAVSAAAPFDLDLPEGFEQVPVLFPHRDPKYLITLVPAGTQGEGSISAFEWTLDPTRRLLTTHRLLGWIEGQTQSFYGGAGAALGPGMMSKVGGHTAICWMIRGFDDPYDGSVDVDACAIVSGHRVIRQACSWKPGMRERIERGCAEARGSLRFS